jgi:hypothetical protein
MHECVRLCGDIHGNIAKYIDLIKDSRYSVQLGDLGFNYESLSVISPEFHKILAGNHDNYTIENNRFVKQTEHFLGDFGVLDIENYPKFFFVRGGESIDKAMRMVDINWWHDEELSYAKCLECLSAYEKARPDYVLSHECPRSLINYICNNPFPPSKTACLLQNMFETHQPKFWFFGHHHKSCNMNIKGTQFRCLKEYETFDIPCGGLL